MDKAVRNELIEALADVEHRQWQKWAESVKDEVSEERRARWEAFFVPYDQLDEATKDLDREWAEEALAAIEPILEQTGGPVKEMITKMEVDSKAYPGLARALGHLVEAKAKKSKGKRTKASKKSKGKKDKKAFAKKMKAAKATKASPEHVVKYEGMKKAKAKVKAAIEGKFPGLNRILAEEGLETPGVPEETQPREVEPGLRQYLETALWSSTDNSDEQGGEPLDANYSIEDIDPAAIEESKKDWEAFKAKAGPLLDGLDMTDVGHDFWLSRNGHGAGFFDADYTSQETADKLQDLAKSFGEKDFYVGDDGKLYFS